jgi:flavin reductase (DIM6/NTAB) family NADH-FMN oxidoreductase RutF
LNDLVQFRRCLGHFATGVTVITCADGNGKLCGITANSFSSVSLEPPLVLWNIAKVSRSLSAYLDAEHFGINVLTARQESVSANFARSDNDLFRDVAYELTARGVPKLANTLAWFDCRTHEVHECGDHYIIIGEVLDYEAYEGEPLMFYRGRYQRLGPA